MADLAKYERYARRIPLFRGLEPEEVAAIIHQGDVIDFREGTTIFHKGQLGSNLFIVLQGRVGIYNESHLIAVCRVGDAFGEMSVLDHRPHSATAMAKTDVRLFLLMESQLNELLHKRVAVRFLLNVIHILSGHLSDSNTMMAMQDREIRELKARLQALGGASGVA
jgi:CRP-like cAMP-binding protein